MEKSKMLNFRKRNQIRKKLESRIDLRIVILEGKYNGIKNITFNSPNITSRSGKLNIKLDLDEDFSKLERKYTITISINKYLDSYDIKRRLAEKLEELPLNNFEKVKLELEKIYLEVKKEYLDELKNNQ